MTKIAIDCTHFVKGKVGGFELYLMNLLDGIFELNETAVTLYVRSDQADYFSKYSKKFTLEFISIKNVYKRILWQNIIFPFYSLRHSVILFPANFRPLVLFCKSVTVIHDLQYIYYPGYWSYWKTFYRKVFIPFSIKHSNKVVTISNIVKQEIMVNFFRSDIKVIYNPIVLKSFLSRIEDIKYKIPSEPFFLIPSSLLPHKNIVNLLTAIDELQYYKDVPKFVFVGSYEKKAFYQKHITPHIIVYGYVDIEHLNLLYRYCKAVILPSVYEGFGMPYVEALVAKKPVVASDIPIAREILKNEAIYIQKPFNSAKIKTALKKILSKDFRYTEPAGCNDLLAQTKPSNVAYKYISLLNEL